MKLPRVRFTIGRLMATVAILALLLGGPLGLWRRRAAFLARHEAHLAKAKELELDFFERGPRMGRLEKSARAKLVKYHIRMQDKYREAAAHPWFPVASNRPEPPTPPGPGPK